MSEQHTPEPWLVSKRTVFALNERGTNIFSALVQDAHTSTEELEANARRIVACVNACAGYSTEDIEQATLDKRHRHEIIADLVRSNKQRDELLSALNAIEPFIPKTSAKEGGAAAYSANVRAADLVRSAIASVKANAQ